VSRGEVAPAEPRKAREAPVRCPPLAAVLHGESCQVAVGGVGAANPGFQHKVPENRPVARTWLDPTRLGLRCQDLDKAKHLCGSRCRSEDPGVAADPHNCGEDQLTEGHVLWAGAEPLQLATANGVVRRSLDHGPEQHANIAENHASSQRRLVSSRSTPSTGTGSRRSGKGAGSVCALRKLCSSRYRRRLSSTNCVSGRRRSAASCSASMSSCSGMSMVMRMMRG